MGANAVNTIVEGLAPKLEELCEGRALLRIWKAMRFSWHMTTMLHSFEGEDRFAAQMRRASLAHLAQSETARRDLAENYVGLPF
jgi:p-hydroxybenzoate 3-monooxygenase